jgi:glycosyltransferase involved in cell wall biosynthesis
LIWSRLLTAAEYDADPVGREDSHPRKTGSVTSLTGPQKQTQPSVSLVIPAYNEEARLGVLFETLAETAEGELGKAGLRYSESVIIDDGSDDATPDLLQEASVEDPRVHPILGRGENRGKGAAVAAGVAKAQGDYVLIVDVDLSTPLSDAPKLTDAFRRKEADVAIGSRDLEGAIVDAPLHRRTLGGTFNLAVRALTGLRCADTQCGFKLMRTETARKLFAEQLSERFAYDVEMLMRARLDGLRIVEVPVTYIHDDRSKVQIGRDSLEMVRDLVRMSVRLRRARRGPRLVPIERA